MDGVDTPLSGLRLVAFDLDGTLIGHRPEFKLYRSFRDAIESIRRRGTIWAVCTGRSMRSFSEAFLPLKSYGIAPDYVITSHAYAFSRGRWGYVPHWAWNFRVRELQWRNEALLRRAMPQLRRLIRSRFPFHHIVHSSRENLIVRFPESDMAEEAERAIRATAQPYRYLRVFRYQNEVDVRSVPFTKGLALSELAGHLSISPSQILVIGDGHNDTSMMDPSVARMTGCPSNSAPEIIEIVHRRGGHVAQERAMAGVLEILNAYETGTVSSALPAGWQDPTSLDTPFEPPNPEHRREARRFGRSMLLFALCLYIILFVFAHFDLVPFSKSILRPYDAAVARLKVMFPSWVP